MKLLIRFIGLIIILTNFAYGSYEIKSYVKDVEVLKNNRYKVFEEILYSDINVSSIYKKISYYDKDKPWGIKDLVVTGADFEVSEQKDFLVIKLYKKNSKFDKQNMIKISYLYDLGLDKNKGLDKVFFKPFKLIEKTPGYLEFSLLSPLNIEDNYKINNLESKAGIYISKKIISYRVNNPVNFKNISFEINLPDNYFKVPLSHDDRFGHKITEIILIITPLLVFLSIIIWLYKGKNNDITIEKLAKLSKEIKALDYGYILNRTVEGKDISTLILEWAIKGYVKLGKKISKDYTNKGYLIKNGEQIKQSSIYITKIKDLDEDAKDYEIQIFDILFNQYGNGEEVSTLWLNNRFYTSFYKIQRFVVDYYEELHSRIFEKTVENYRKLIYIFSFIPITIAVYEIFYKLTDEKILLALGISIIYVILYFYISMLLIIDMENTKTYRYNKGEIFFISTVWLVQFLIFIYVSYPLSATLDMIVGQLGSFIIIVISTLLCKRTELGFELHNKILGVKKFIISSTDDEIAVNDNDNMLFYHNLPIAISLDILDNWVEKFENGSITDPDWLLKDDQKFNKELFKTELLKIHREITKSLTSNPNVNID